MSCLDVTDPALLAAALEAVPRASENLSPDLALCAERVLEERRDGWLRPLATAGALEIFLDAWRRNDPNGTWGHVTEVGDSLVLSRNDDDESSDVFPAGRVQLRR